MAAAKPSHSRPEMENLAYRESLLAEHPIITRGYTIATPMIEACYQVFRERVWLRRRGTVLYADTCTGKTTCSEAVEALLCMEFPNIYLASVDAQKSLGIRSFLKDLIDACGLALSGRETAMAMGEILLMGVQTECDKRKGNHFVLIIDEMQNLQEDEFTQLATLGNRLHRRHISMTTLGFAQPDITHLMKGFLASRKRNLVARFLAEQIIFEGCQDEKTLETILDAYDHEKIYPPESGWSYVQFFFPKAFSAGFRLKNFAPLIWTSLDSARQDASLESVPMDHVTRVVEYLLTANRVADATKFRFSKTQVTEAVAASDLASLENLILPAREHVSPAH